MKKIYFAFLVVVFSFGILNAQTTTYNFNALVAGNLTGQDGWVTTQYPTLTSGDMQVAAAQGFDLTNALYYNLSGGGYGVDASKPLTAGLFSDLTASYKISFETAPGVWGINAGIGYDANLDGKITSADNNEKSIVYNTTPTDVSATIFGTVPISVPTTYTGNWVRIEMLITQLSTGGKITIREFNLVTSTWRTILNNANLGVTTAADNTNPANWNMIFTHMEGAPCSIDNIKIEKNPAYSEVVITGNDTLCSGVITPLTANATAYGSIPFINNTSIAIPDNNPTGILSPLTVANTFANATQVYSVTINIPTTYTEDLVVTLYAPDGSLIDLTSNNGGSSDNYTETVFTSTAATSITTGTGPFTGTFLPEQPFSLLTGSADGIWNLKVADIYGGDIATLLNWTLNITNTITNYSWSTGETGAAVSTINFNPLVNTSVSVTVTDGAGTTANNQINLTVTTSPTAAISGDNSLCAGESTILLANGTAFGISSGVNVSQANNTSYPIPDANATGVQSPITIANSNALASQVVSVTINSLPHSYDGDLRLILIAPDGSSIPLSNNRGNGGDNFTNTIFTPTAVTPIASGSAPFTGSFLPEQPFTNLTGSAQGTWNLHAIDDYGADVGSINEWTLTLPPNNSITNYSWSTGETTAQINNTPAITTVFTVTVTDANSCSATNSANVVVTPLIANPIIANSTICYGTIDTLIATGPNGIYNWWNDATAGTLISTGQQFITPILTSTSTYWVSAPPLASISTTYAAGNGQNGNMFDITAINNLTIDSLNINLQAGTGNISVYYKLGTYVGSEATAANWTLLGTETVTSAGTNIPTRVHIGGLNMLAGQTYGLYITTDGANSVSYTNGANTYSDANISLSLGAGIMYPFAAAYTPRTWNGDIYYSTPNLCESNRVPVTVNVNPLPTIALTSSATESVCLGNSANISLALTGTAPWTWVGNDGTGPATFNAPTSPTTSTVTPIVNTTYNIISITDANGCTNTSTENVVVTVNTLPTIALTSAATATICQGGNTDITLALTGTAPWSWISNDGTGPVTLNALTNSATLNVAPITNTTYNIISVTDANGCTGTSTENVFVTVDAAPVAGTATAASLSVCTGSGTTIDLASSTGNIQWQSSSDGTTWVDITGETTATLNTGNLTSVIYYQSVVSNGICAPVTSNNQMISINALPTIALTSANAVTICNGANTDISLALTGTAPWTWVGNDGSGPASFNETASPATSNVAPTTSTTYSILSVTDANGCTNSSTDAVVVTVNPLPIVNLGSDITQCGGTATLDAGNTGSVYLWSDASTNQTLVASVSGTYSVIVTDGNTCEGLDTIVVTINSSVPVSITENTGLLTSDATSGNQWYDANGIIAGETGTTYTPTVTGNYYVIVTDVNGCTSMSNTISFVLSLSNIGLSSSLNIYPNPAKDKVFVEVSNSNNTHMSIELMSLDGRVLYENSSEVSGKLILSINLNEYASGIYMIKAVSVNNTLIQKLVIQ